MNVRVSLIVLAAASVAAGLTAVASVAAARSSLTAASLAGTVAGKRADGLSATLRRVCRPERICDYTTVLDGRLTTDFCTGLGVEVSRPMSVEYAVAPIAPASWWTDGESGAVNVYGDTVKGDLFNLGVISRRASEAVAGLPPGEPDKVKGEMGQPWSVGTVELAPGFDVAVYAPADGQRGRVARAYLYMATVYPQRVMSPAAMMVLTGGETGLSDYWRDVLLKWTKECPPTADERREAEMIGAAQGGGNPFVLLPGIEEYIWGSHRGEVYAPVYQGADPSSPESPDDTPGEGSVTPVAVPLHGRYRLGESIRLASPHVPDDAEWSVDGARMAQESVEASALGAGSHEICFTSPSTGRHGRVIIFVES